MQSAVLTTFVGDVDWVLQEAPGFNFYIFDTILNVIIYLIKFLKEYLFFSFVIIMDGVMLIFIHFFLFIYFFILQADALKNSLPEKFHVAYRQSVSGGIFHSKIMVLFYIFLDKFSKLIFLFIL